MIKVDVEIDNKFWFKKIKDPKKYLTKRIKKITKKINFLKGKSIVFTILLTNSLNIRKLNKKFRKKNKITDVLSFPFFSRGKLNFKNKNSLYVGDIAVCFEVIKDRSKKNSFFLEFDKAWIHGFLHLLGYDHIKNKDYLKMKKTEKKLINFKVYE